MRQGVLLQINMNQWINFLRFRPEQLLLLLLAVNRAGSMLENKIRDTSIAIQTLSHSETNGRTVFRLRVHSNAFGNEIPNTLCEFRK